MARTTASSLAQAEQQFQAIYGTLGVSQTGQRVNELFEELRSWFGEYLDEVTRFTESDRSADRGTEYVSGSDTSTGKGAGQSETGSPEGSL